MNTADMKHPETDIVKGIVAGVAGGLLASFMMEQFQALWTKTSEVLQSDRADGAPKSQGKQEKPATVKQLMPFLKRLPAGKCPRSNRRWPVKRCTTRPGVEKLGLSHR